MKIYAEIAEAAGMNDADEIPGVMKRAEEAGKKWGNVLKRGS
jgi:hypothetical protein